MEGVGVAASCRNRSALDRHAEDRVRAVGHRLTRSVDGHRRRRQPRRGDARIALRGQVRQRRHDRVLRRVAPDDRLRRHARLARLRHAWHLARHLAGEGLDGRMRMRMRMMRMRMRMRMDLLRVVLLVVREVIVVVVQAAQQGQRQQVPLLHRHREELRVRPDRVVVRNGHHHAGRVDQLLDDGPEGRVVHHVREQERGGARDRHLPADVPRLQVEGQVHALGVELGLSRVLLLLLLFRVREPVGLLLGRHGLDLQRHVEGAGLQVEVHDDGDLAPYALHHHLDEATGEGGLRVRLGPHRGHGAALVDHDRVRLLNPRAPRARERQDGPDDDVDLDLLLLDQRPVGRHLIGHHDHRAHLVRVGEAALPRVGAERVQHVLQGELPARPREVLVLLVGRRR
mmetsp:Transcript_26545/g.58384  ORF Transcript_26545/g.58384 Transcript_26545/m.58384 type:complete len:399 (+) Transcript_26545:322-1518(+)